jgi:hypothetical protein
MNILMAAVTLRRRRRKEAVYFDQIIWQGCCYNAIYVLQSRKASILTGSHSVEWQRNRTQLRPCNK